MIFRKFTIQLSSATLLLAGFAAWTSADAADNFYKGKQIRLIVSTAPGGVYDAYARIMGKHLSDHIPGKPTFIVQNMPGASGLKTASYMFKLAPRDGTVIASTHSSIPTAPLLAPKGARFDVNKFSWIGSITRDPFVGYVWHTAPIKTFDEAKKTVVTMGGNSVGSAGVDMAIISNKWFGTKFKIVTGYKGSATTKLAIEKGEVNGTFANSWGDLKTQKMSWITEKKVRIIVQHGFFKHPELSDVPMFVDQAKNNSHRQGLRLLLARQDFSKPYFAPPEVPASRVALLRNAFAATLKDPKFLATAKKAHLAIDHPMGGTQLAAEVAKVSSTPGSVVKSIEKLFSDFRAGKR